MYSMMKFIRLKFVQECVQSSHRVANKSRNSGKIRDFILNQGKKKDIFKNQGNQGSFRLSIVSF